LFAGESDRVLATLRQRNFALLWVAGLVSVAGDYALLTALPLHAYALTGSAVATGAVFAAALLPRVVLGSVAGVFVDRWDRQRTMVTADLLRAIALVPLLAVDSADLLWLLYLMRLVTGTLSLFFNPAESALLPRLVGEERLVTANALNALNNNLGRLIGPAVGGVLYATSGLGAVVVGDAASFLVSAGLIAAIRANTRPERGDLDTDTDTMSAGQRVLGEWRAGLQLIRGDRALSAIFLAFGLGFLGEGTFEVGFVPLTVSVFGGGAAAVGILLSAQAIGGILAGAGIARVSTLVAPRLLFAGGLIGIGLIDLGLANAARLTPSGLSPVLLAAAFMILAGFPAVAGLAAGNGLLQSRTSDAFRGRVFGALEAASSVATLVGLGLGGLAIDVVGVVPVVSAGALMWVAGGVVALVRLPPERGDALARAQPVGEASG
jgi:predicted MFS family arabinose efflux permease